jgi:hypothetical protein
MQTVAATARRLFKQRRSLESVFPAFQSGVASKNYDGSWPSNGPADARQRPVRSIDRVFRPAQSGFVGWFVTNSLKNWALLSHRALRTSHSLYQ